MGTHLFDDLPAVLEAYKPQIAAAVTLVAQKAALAGGAYLAAETPVDTGVARSNWIMTIDVPFIGVLPAYVPYPSYRMNHHEAVKTLVTRKAHKNTGGSRYGFSLGAFSPAKFKGTP